MKMRKFIFVISCLAASLAVFSADQVNVYFNADGAEIGVAKVEAGNTYTIAQLLTAAGISNPTGCRGYNFIGWKTGGPVEEDVTPTCVPNVTPAANVNLYAVYQRSGAAANRYTRITTTSDLTAGKYLIVCYYEWDGDVYYGPSYFALGNTQSMGADGKYWGIGDTYTPRGRFDACRNTECDVYAPKYSISASQIYPNAGAVENPGNTIVWTLSGSEGAWKWTNGTGNSTKTLYIRRGLGQKYYDCNDNVYIITGQSYNEQILTNGDNNYTCSVTAANGAFNFENGGYYLTYSEDENDYFQTGTSNEWTFYLYKKESEYTSFPNCSNWTVHLDANDGTIVGISPDTSKTDVQETSSGSGVTLPSATMSGADCSSWVFSGWHSESPVYGTTTPPTLHTGSYTPGYNNETLYAVYQTGENATYWERVTNASDIQNGDVCVIATTGNNPYAVTTSYQGSNTFDGASITVSGNRISGTPSTSIQWTFNGTYFVGKNGNTNVILSYNGSNTTYYYKTQNETSPFVLVENSWDAYLSYSGYQFTEGNTATTYYIYKKVTTYATYSSFPHCTPYTVTLNACGGTVEGARTETKTEATAGAGIPLPDAVPLCPEEGWSFVGWMEGGEVGSIEDVDFTGLWRNSYAPSRDGVTLYAVFRRNINIFRILYQPEEMVAGDNYLITAYDGTYDYEISSAKYNNNYLSGVQAAAPQGGEGYYIEVDTTAAGWENVLWTMAGTYNNCTFLNVGDSKYLSSTNDGYTTTENTATSYTIARPTSNFYFTVRDRDHNNRYINYNTTYQYFSTATSPNVQMFVYRQMKMYTSWPHCEPFTVNFDGCGGNAGATSVTEAEAYAGITLPDAYVNSDCSKEGWSFVGWATEPVSEESNSLPLDVLPAGTHYSPSVDNGTLYAVYQQKGNTYKRIYSLSDLRLGLDYIIATSSNRALSNTAANTNYVASKEVTPASNIITSDDGDITWRIQGTRGAYVFYNAERTKYLDLSTEGYALLQDNEVDQFVLLYGAGSFFVRSIQALSNTKYLGYTSNYFNTVESENVTAIYFYQQQATYHSYPLCADDLEALRWEIDNGENYVYVESYVLKNLPKMDGSIGDASPQSDGTIKIKYNSAVIPANTQTHITWDNTYSKLRMPFVVASSQNISTIGLPSPSTECDIVVLPGAILTVDENTEVHHLTVYDGATLDISNGITLTVNSLVLFSEGDQNAPAITLNTSGAIVLKNGELYHDRRIDEERYYWLTLPYNAQLQEISYSNLAANGGAPVYRTNYWVKYYNGLLRANDVNGSSLASNYWQHVAARGSDYTLQAGQGYIVGIANQKTITQADGRTHTKRVLRFTMTPNESTWLTQERSGGKVTNVEPSSANDPKNAVHVGWNLIGNPYMSSYSIGNPGTSSGLQNGEWTKDEDGFYVIDESVTPTNIPYLTIYDPAEDSYSQTLASTYRALRPFEAVFVQVNTGNQIYFQTGGISRNAPAYMRFLEPEAPVRTGITLSGVGKTDATGIVLSEEYSLAYEIGADLVKCPNNGALNLYTLNADSSLLAFNGLSDNDAITPIPVGATFPVAGEYTFAFDDKSYSINDMDTLQLIDKDKNISVDLLSADYTFSIENPGTVNKRFELFIRRAQKTEEEEEETTNVDNTNNADNSTRKFIRNGQLFIIRDGKIYDVIGARVR